MVFHPANKAPDHYQVSGALDHRAMLTPRFIDICKKVVVNHWFQRFTMVYHRFTNMYPYVSCILLCFDIAKFSRFSQRGSWPSWLRLGVPRHASQEEISQAWTYSQTSVGWGILMLGWLILPKSQIMIISRISGQLAFQLITKITV